MWYDNICFFLCNICAFNYDTIYTMKHERKDNNEKFKCV